MITTISLANIHPPGTKRNVFSLEIRTFRIYSLCNFQICPTALSTTVLMLYITPPVPIYLITGSWTTSFNAPTTLPLFFKTILTDWYIVNFATVLPMPQDNPPISSFPLAAQSLKLVWTCVFCFSPFDQLWESGLEDEDNIFSSPLSSPPLTSVSL